jgi:methionine-S-sulfoxide reductase
VPGVLLTRVGYAGGSKDSPTYYGMGDHVETVQVIFDPTRVTYRELLDVFAGAHNPSSPKWKRQYISAIYYSDNIQQDEALKWRADYEDKRKRKVNTEIAQAGTFFLAEGYHQKYYLQRRPDLVRELKAIFGAEDYLIVSSAATVLNAFVGDELNASELKRALGALNLPADKLDYLLELAIR